MGRPNCSRASACSSRELQHRAAGGHELGGERASTGEQRVVPGGGFEGLGGDRLDAVGARTRESELRRQAVDRSARHRLGAHHGDDDAVAVASRHCDRVAVADVPEGQAVERDAAVVQRAGWLPPRERRERDRAAERRAKPEPVEHHVVERGGDRVEVAECAEHHRHRVAWFDGEHVGPADRLEGVVGVGCRHEGVADALVEQLELVGFHHCIST